MEARPSPGSRLTQAPARLWLPSLKGGPIGEGGAEWACGPRRRRACAVDPKGLDPAHSVPICHWGWHDPRPPQATTTQPADKAESGGGAMGQLVEQPKTRKSHLTTAQFAILNDACLPVAEAFDSSPYLVGSATERADFRDIDLRIILEDEEFDRLFGDRKMLWSMVCLSIGEYLANRTGLPIDFQIQRMTEANEKHPTTHRNPMGMRARPLAGGGDATPW